MVQQGDYLLQKNSLNIDTREIDKKEMQTYLRQTPNRRTFLIFKFHLAVYNFSKLGKERKWKKWLENVIGEEPSVYDSLLMVKTKIQFEQFLKNSAYYNATVATDVKFKRKRAWVSYQVKAGRPIVINRVYYDVADTTIASIIYSDTSQSLLNVNSYFTLESLENERDRLVEMMRDSGYYQFNSDYVRYVVDTNNYKANIQVEVGKALKEVDDGTVMETAHQRFWIKKVFFYPNYDPQEAIKNRANYFNSFDTLNYKGFYFLYSGLLNVKPKTILKADLIYPNQMYNYSNIRKTNRYLNSLRLFRLSNITFKEVPDSDSLLNCYVQMTPFTYQNFSVNLESTNTEGNFGLGGNLGYQHRNLFKGAEILDMKVSGAFQRQSKGIESKAYNIYEFGAEAKLETPSFILPFNMYRFYKKYNPKTSFSLSYNIQHKPTQYTRKIVSASMGYNWKGSDKIKNILVPIDLSAVTIPMRTAAFDSSIQGKYYENSYKDYFIPGGKYSLIFQNSDLSNRGQYSLFRWNVESAGNLFYLFNKTIGTDTAQGGYYQLFGLQYAQFVKTDIDYRFYYTLSSKNLVVYRLFAGIGIPYGNARSIPFVRQYMAGGAEGIRAWHAKELGPGSYRQYDTLPPNQTADIKLEMNVEYRYDISKTLKGAMFVDVGNIWAIKEEPERPGAQFMWNQFYKQLAVGTGLGLRFDFTFAVFRIDAGVKVKDPSISGKDGWVLFNQPFVIKNDVLLQFGIGYPF